MIAAIYARKCTDPNIADEGGRRMRSALSRRTGCVALALAVALGGCASSSLTYGPDGREAHALNCSGFARTWAMCAQKAGEICGTRGYDVIAAGGGTAGTIATVTPSSGFAGPVIERSMLIRCK